jgi:hypothetical protein
MALDRKSMEARMLKMKLAEVGYESLRSASEERSDLRG